MKKYGFLTFCRCQVPFFRYHQFIPFRKFYLWTFLKESVNIDNLRWKNVIPHNENQILKKFISHFQIPILFSHSSFLIFHFLFPIHHSLSSISYFTFIIPYCPFPISHSLFLFFATSCEIWYELFNRLMERWNGGMMEYIKKLNEWMNEWMF